MERWLSKEETALKIAILASKDTLYKAYALSNFVDCALYSADFTPSDAWTKVVVPTDSGREILQALADTGLKFSLQTQFFTLFRLFYYRDLLVDHQKTDLDGVLKLLRDMHKTKDARWPYVFGNGLYQKFNNDYDGNRTNSLEAVEAHKLLAETPQGVFQIGAILSGPLGFLHSEELRTILPTLELPLWHCSDPGCKSSHSVRLEQHKNDCDKALSTYIRYLRDNFWPPSEWHTSILFSYRDNLWPVGRTYSDISAVIADCLIGPERTTLCLSALRSPYNKLLTEALREADRSGRPEDVEKLSPEEQHQLLLLLPDKDIVRMIDELVCLKNIPIPPSELRRPKTYLYKHNRDCRSRLSSLGISSTKRPPLIELSTLIWNTYETLGNTDELTWHVRENAGPTLHHSVMNFVRLHKPEAAVRKLILSSHKVTTAICNNLLFSIHPKETEQMTCNRLLWKLGFNQPRYEDEYMLLRTRLINFKDEVLKMSVNPSEHERAAVRACGVNLFVSVESFLENIVCYNVWMMASDHFTGTSFMYMKEDALVTVGRVLGREIKSGEETIYWRTNGNNTIGVLMAYLHAFRQWLKDHSDTDKSKIKRREVDYPHYAKDTLCVFPFKHTELWADTASEIMKQYVDQLDNITVQIVQADLMLVRNGLDHKRDDNAFPTSDKMLACVTRLQQVIDTTDDKRLLPKLFWGMETNLDADGNICDKFIDYRGIALDLYSPSPVVGLPKQNFSTPYMIAPFDFLNQPNSTLVFGVSPRTEYREYWKNYPRRRIIPSNTEVPADRGKDDQDDEQPPAKQR